MTQTTVRFASFEEYLFYSDAVPMDGHYELVDGVLAQWPPESEPNNWIADNLQFLLAIANILPRRLIKTHSCEVQVPVLQPKDAANRYPDLVVLRPEHLELTQRRLTITLDMPPPRLIVEVVSWICHCGRVSYGDATRSPIASMRSPGTACHTARLAH